MSNKQQPTVEVSTHEQGVNERIPREVMGWEIRPATSYRRAKRVVVYQLGDPRYRGGALHIINIPDFEHSLDACAIAEAEIKKRGLQEKYLEVIWSEYQPSSGARTNWTMSMEFAARCLHLAPAQRCAAMLAAVEASRQ